MRALSVLPEGPTWPSPFEQVAVDFEQPLAAPYEQVADIRTGEPMKLGPYECGVLLALTVADFCEQWHGWQDRLFATAADGGRMR